LEELASKLAVLNKLPLQKWLNAISETDTKMSKAIKCNAKHIALELKKEERKKRNLSGPSHTANTSSTMNSDKRMGPYNLIKYNRTHGALPPLTEEECSLLYEHRGCFKC